MEVIHWFRYRYSSDDYFGIPVVPRCAKGLNEYEGLLVRVQARAPTAGFNSRFQCVILSILLLGAGYQHNSKRRFCKFTSKDSKCPVRRSSCAASCARRKLSTGRTHRASELGRMGFVLQRGRPTGLGFANHRRLSDALFLDADRCFLTSRAFRFTRMKLTATSGNYESICSEDSASIPPASRYTAHE